MGDFSYVDLHAILSAATQGMDPEQAKQAAQVAVDNFERMKLHVDVRMDADIQLMVQHALQYQAFNHPQLKGRRKQGLTAAEAEQNRFRQFELDKSKAMLVHDASHGFGRTLPPSPPNLNSARVGILRADGCQPAAAPEHPRRCHLQGGLPLHQADPRIRLSGPAGKQGALPPITSSPSACT